MSHAANEVAVCGGHSAFPFGKNAHVSAEAGSASRRGNHGAAFNKNFEKARFKSLEIYLLRGRDYNAPYAFRDFFAFENFRRSFQIVKSAVCAGADYRLVNLNFPD